MRSGLPLDNITVKLGDSTLPQAPVEGGSWGAASVAHAMPRPPATCARELLRAAKTMPNSPLADAKPEGVALLDGRLVDAKDRGRSVSIADVMRHGRLDRIERESTEQLQGTTMRTRATPTRRSSRK